MILSSRKNYSWRWKSFSVLLNDTLTGHRGTDWTIFAFMALKPLTHQLWDCLANQYTVLLLNAYLLTTLSANRSATFSGVRSSYASQHSQLGQDLRSAISPDRHIAPIYEDRTFQGPLYRSPSHTQGGTLYRSTSGWSLTIYTVNQMTNHQL